MTKKEYLDTLIEQIGNRHAKQLVAQEYEDHIEDQKAAYMEAGMEESEAEQQAVRQMGNPIEAGTRLNQIHRPKFPTGLFVIVLMLTGIGIVMQLRSVMGNLSLWGNHALPANIPTGDMYSTFIVTGIFSWFGIVVGCIVVGLLFFFCFRALQLSIRQKNRMGMLIGMACTASILLRSIVCTAINFGFGLYYTSSVPFLSYGKLATIVNALYVGLILCVCRNEAVMPEKQMVSLRRHKNESSHEYSA